MSVNVTYGANVAVVEAGSSVAQLRARYAAAFNIPEGAIAQVDGENVGCDHVPADGEELEFVRAAGEKG